MLLSWTLTLLGVFFFLVIATAGDILVREV